MNKADPKTRLIRMFIRMFNCDTARISSPCGIHFLVIGWNERSVGEWHDQDGKPRNFPYVREQVIASGHTLKQLVAPAKSYKELCGPYLRPRN